MNDHSPLRMTVHDWFDGPYPDRVRIAIAEKNLQDQVRFAPVSLWKGEHKEPAFLAMNYSGTLPVLELTDGTLIAECLDNLAGPPSLTGTTPLEKGGIHMMSRRAELELLDATSFYFHHATPGLGPRSSVTRIGTGACASATGPCAPWATSTCC